MSCPLERYAATAGHRDRDAHCVGTDPSGHHGGGKRIREALINLIFNAVDAMPIGGVLTLRTRTAEPPAGLTKLRSVVVEVADNGLGMDEETRRHCLEPFFTTKGERGTGLGLAMVYGMVQRHDADFEIESIPDRGTTVRLSFSVPAGEATDLAPETPRPIPSRARILVVDDDPRCPYDEIRVEFNSSRQHNVPVTWVAALIRLFDPSVLVMEGSPQERTESGRGPDAQVRVSG